MFCLTDVKIRGFGVSYFFEVKLTMKVTSRSVVCFGVRILSSITSLMVVRKGALSGMSVRRLRSLRTVIRDRASYRFAVASLTT